MGNARKDEKCQKVCIITGLSGAGKSTALRVFEDLRYFSVDGLPAKLAPEMADMMRRKPMRHFSGIAMCMDLRQENFLNEYNSTVQRLNDAGFCVKLVFLEAADEAIMRRYASTRRPHPLERNGLGLKDAIDEERQMLQPLRNMADLVIDSSSFSIHDLRRIIREHISREDANLPGISVNILSFGFKYGIPNDADFIFDLRFLSNPYFIEKLRPLSGKDREVIEYIFKNPIADEYKHKLLELLLFVLSVMEEEGRYRVTIAFGCTGGRHRSVAMAEAIAQQLAHAGYNVVINHRNLDFDLVK